MEIPNRTAISRRAGRPGSENDHAAVIASLKAQPGVACVLHNRLVKGHRLRVRTLPAPVFSIAVGAGTFDTYYNSPQDWTVRQVGGYGRCSPHHKDRSAQLTFHSVFDAAGQFFNLFGALADVCRGQLLFALHLLLQLIDQADEFLRV